jgi:hypothetical protein
MVRFSSGLRNYIANTGSLKAAFANGCLDLYSGVQPSSANNAITGTLLCRVTLNAGAFTAGASTNGLNLDTPVVSGTSVTISKVASDVWKGLGLGAGSIGWGRFKANALDNEGASTTLIRIDFSVGVIGADCNIPSVDVVTGTPITFSTFDIPLLESTAG